MVEPLSRPGHLQYLERARLDTLFDKLLCSPVVVVTAGAGYGKSHAVQSYLQKRNIASVWVQFTERDNIGDRFWDTFTRAVAAISRKSAERLAKVGFPETEQKFERYLAVPLEDIDAKKKYVFVYDDFHLIHDKAVLRFLERSITSPFPNITSILVSRTSLQINLIKLFSKGLMASLGENDLRFSKAETEAFFLLQGIAVSPEMLDMIEHDTEGWAFAMHIAGLCLKTFPGTDGYKIQVRLNIFRLIESELMSQIDSDTRNFLVKLSLVDESLPDLLRELARIHCSAREAETTGSAGDAAVVQEKSLELIRKITGIGSFIRYDEYENTFTIHRLLRDYLSEYQSELSEDGKKAVYRAAAWWCVKHGRKIDALLYFEKAREYDVLIDQINAMPLNVSDKTLRMLMALLDRIPDLTSKYAETYLVLSRCLLRVADLGDMRKKFMAIIASYEALPESETGNRILFSCYCSIGFIIKLLAPMTGDFSFPEYFIKGHYYKTRWGGEMKGPLTIANVGTYICRVGSKNPEEIDRYLAALNESVPAVSAAMGGNMSGLEELALGELAFFRMNAREAVSRLTEAVVKARENNQGEIQSRALFYLLRLAIAQGDVVLLAESRQALISQVENETFTNRFIFDDLYRGWFYAQLNECGKVPQWLKQECDEERGDTLLRGLELLVQARYRFRLKKYASALTALKQASHNAGLFIMGKIEAKVLEAVCLYHMKNKAEAYTALRDAVALAEPNGFYTPFAELGKDMRSLVIQAARDNVPFLNQDTLEKIRKMSAAYIKKLYIITGELSAIRVLSGNTALSSKESDVLFALFQGFTQDEIAKSSSRSVNTIKSIIRRIYEKLGAVNKADAIRLAMSQGLLDWEREKQPELPRGTRPLLIKKPSGKTMLLLI